MTTKEKFISEIETILATNPISEEAMSFFNELKSSAPIVTEKGINILSYVQKQSMDYIFTAKMLAEQIDMNTRSISGTIRKLITDGFLEKVGNSSPLTYKITESGYNLDLDNIKNK